MFKPVRTPEKSERFHRRPKSSSRSRITVLLFVLTSLSGLVYSGYLPSAQATTSASWNPKVQCTPQIVRITDITANKTGSASFTASPFNPGETTTVSGGDAKRWLTPSSSTPTGWHSPGPSCTNSNGQALFVEIDGVERSSISVEDPSSTYDPVNGGGNHPGSTTTYDNTFNIFDPAIVPNFSGDCTSATDPTCPGRIHSEIDHDWLAAGYCGSGTTCDPSTFASQVGYASTKFDIQGFVYWDPGHLSANYHNFNGWEIHPVTGWRLSGQKDYGISASPSSLSFSSGSTGSFTITISAQNGFTGTVNLSTSTSPSKGLSVNCSPSSISTSGSSVCTLNSSTVGTYAVTVTGTSGSLSHSTSVSVTVSQPANPDFTISANPTSLSIVQGSSGQSTVTLNSISGFSGTVNLSASVSPPGPGTSFSSTSVTLSPNGSGSSTLTVTTAGAPLGSYTVNITGTSNSGSHSSIVTVSVVPVPPPPDFSMSASPTSLTLGQPSSTTLTSVPVTTSGDRTWFESSYLADSFSAQGLIWLFYEDSSVNCEGMAGCLFYTSSPTGSNWAKPTNLNVHVTDSDFSVFTDGSNVYYARYDESTFESTCGMNIFFRTGVLQASSATVNWQNEQVALKGLSTNTYPNEEIVVDSTGQAWIAFLSDSHSACKGNGTDLPQIIHSSGTNYASWTTPFTLSTAHSNNWHIALVSLGNGQIYASFWLANADLHGKLFNGSIWGADEQISPPTTKNDVNAWVFNSGTNVYAIYFDNGPETFNFASRSSTGTWTTNVIGVGESRTGSGFSSQYYSFPDAASYDPTHNQFYLFWMNATLQRIDEWKGSGSSWTKTTQIISTGAAPYPDSIISFITPPMNGFSATGGIFYITGSSAPFTYHFAAMPLSGSSTGTFTVTITGQNGFSGTVNLTTSVNPGTGLTVTCSPTSVSGGSGSSSCTVTSSTAGNYNVTITGTSGSLSHSASVSVVVQTSSADFSISASPASVNVNAGSTVSSTITVAPVNGFSGTVNLSVATNSTNLVCSLSSSSITTSGTSTLSCHGSPAANYLATVTGTSGSLSHSATVTLHVQDFSMSASTTSVTSTVGAAGTSSIAVSSLNGFTGTVNLASTTNSTNLSCTLSSSTVSGSGSSTLSCNSSVAANYLATVTGTSGGLSHNVQVTYHITAAPDFTISANPTSVSATTGTAGTSTITVASLNGFTGTVTLGVSTNSTSLSCNLSSTTITNGSGTSTLSCTGPATGSDLATVTASSGSLSHSASVTYHVSPPPDFTISSNPTVLTDTVSVAGSSTITVMSQNGFTGTVALSVLTNSTRLSCNLSNTNIPSGSGTSNLSCTSSVAGDYLATVTGSNNTLSHSTTVTYHVKANPDFTVTANPTSLSLNARVVGNSTISVAALNGFSGTVNLSIVTNSTNLQCSLAQTTVSGGSGTSTLSCTSSTAGNYHATVTGSSGTISHPTTVTYIVQDFAISSNPTSVSVGLGTSGNSTIIVASINGFAGTVTLSVTTNSTNLSCSLSSSTITGSSGTSNLSCTGSFPGNYAATVSGINAKLSHSTTVTYHVSLIPGFAISADPTVVTPNVGGLGNSTITISPENGFTGTVLISVTTNSTNLACTASPSSVAGGSGTAILSCSSNVAGNYLSVVTGTSGQLSHSANATYEITAPAQSGFTLTISPTSVTIHPGFSGLLSNVFVTSNNNFSGTVTLAANSSATLSFSLSPSTFTFSNGALTCDPHVLSCNMSLLDVTSASSTPLGSYTVNVTGTSGSLTSWATMTLIVAPSDFTVSVSPSSMQVDIGLSPPEVSLLVGVGVVNGFSGNVTLVLTTSGNGISCQFVNNAGSSLGTRVTLNLAFGSTNIRLWCGTPGPAGTYTGTITGTSGSLTHAVTFSITVMDFSISATNVSFAAGSSGNSTVTLTSLSGLSGNLTLTVSTPSGLSGTCPSSVILPSGGISSITCKFAGTVPGTYVANMTALCNGCDGAAVISHTAAAGITVSSPQNPNFTLASSPSSLTIIQGSSGSSTITLSSLNSFSGTITLTGSTSPAGPTLTFTPTTVTLGSGGTGSSSLIVSTAGAVVGTYHVNVTGASGSLSHSQLVTVTITAPTSSPAYALAVSYEGFVYKLYPNNTLVQIAQPVTTQLSVVAWRPDGSCAIIAGNAAVLIKYDGTTLTIVPTGIATSVNFLSAAWRPDGSYALIGGSGGVLLKYDCNTVTQVSNSFAVSFRAISWKPDGSQALLVTYFGKIYQYTDAAGTIVQLTSPTTQSLDAVAWNPNGSYALIAGAGGAILRYDGATLTVLNTAGIYSSTLNVRYISFNPTGNLALLVGDSGLVLTYDGTTLTALPSITSSTLYSVSWSNGTAYIVGGSGALITYSSGVETSVPNNTFSGFRSIAWKP